MADRQEEGRVKEFFTTAYNILKEKPELLQEGGFGLYRTLIKQAFPELDAMKKEGRCPNCKKKMIIYERHVDYHASVLLRGMADVVKRKIIDGMKFTDANQVHVQDEIRSNSYSVKSYTTITRQLGLIAKVEKQGGGHDREKGWLITRRGWAFLKNEPVPRTVWTYNNRIVDRTEEEITIGEIMSSRRVAYDPKDYVEIAGYSEGSLF